MEWRFTRRGAIASLKRIDSSSSYDRFMGLRARSPSCSCGIRGIEGPFGKLVGARRFKLLHPRRAHAITGSSEARGGRLSHSAQATLVVPRAIILFSSRTLGHQAPRRWRS